MFDPAEMNMHTDIVFYLCIYLANRTDIALYSCQDLSIFFIWQFSLNLFICHKNGR